jgi:hypothetical protein
VQNGWRLRCADAISGCVTKLVPRRVRWKPYFRSAMAAPLQQWTQLRTTPLWSAACRDASAFWAAAGFKDTLLRWKMELEVVYGNETAVQPGVQA